MEDLETSQIPKNAIPEIVEVKKNSYKNKIIVVGICLVLLFVIVAIFTFKIFAPETFTQKTVATKPFQFHNSTLAVKEIDVNIASLEAITENQSNMADKTANGHYLFLFGDGNDLSVPSYLIYDGEIVFKGNISENIALSKNGKMYGFTTSVPDSNYGSSNGALYINEKRIVTSKYNIGLKDLENNGEYVYTIDQGICDNIFCHPPTKLYTSTGRLIQQFSENEVTVNQASADFNNISYTFNENTTFGMSTNVFDDYLNGSLLRYDSQVLETFSDNFKHNLTASDQQGNGCAANLYEDGQVIGKTGKFNGTDIANGTYDGTSPEVNNAGEYAYVDPNNCKGGYTVYLQSHFIQVPDKSAVAFYFNPSQTHLLVGYEPNASQTQGYLEYTWKLDGKSIKLPFKGNNNNIELDDNVLYIYNFIGGGDDNY
jgi:hypothetical protein